MTLKVIGAGLGRTGTLSLKFALEYLGLGPCHHMAEIWANFDDQLPKWLDVVGGKPDWPAVFEGYQSVVDYPGCTYWRELADLYPDARIILTVRDPESWFSSVNSTIFSPIMLAGLGREPLNTFFEGTVIGDFGDRIGDRAFMVDYFRRHVEAVIAQAPPERLLVFEAKQGWDPLCAFLGVPVPAIPFPRVNSREEMLERMAGAGQEAGPPPGLDALMSAARSHLEHQRQAAFAAMT